MESVFSLRMKETWYTHEENRVGLLVHIKYSDYHHQVMQTAWISLILSCQPSLSSVAPWRSSRRHPVSTQRYWISYQPWGDIYKNSERIFTCRKITWIAIILSRKWYWINLINSVLIKSFYMVYIDFFLIQAFHS